MTKTVAKGNKGFGRGVVGPTSPFGRRRGASPIGRGISRRRRSGPRLPGRSAFLLLGAETPRDAQGHRYRGRTTTATRSQSTLCVLGLAPCIRGRRARRKRARNYEQEY